MKRFSLSQLLLTLAVAVVLWLLIAAACLFMGSGGWGLPESRYIFTVRAQSIALASLVGAALGAAGVAYQAVLRNPLADPYLLGVSSGASLASYLWRVPGISGISVLAAALSQQGFALAGALAAVAVVFALSSRRGRIEPVTLLLVGVIVNAINGAIFLLINALRPEITGQGGGIIGFLAGGIQNNLGPYQAQGAAYVCAVTFVLLMALTPGLNVAGLSEAEAQSLGVRIHRLRWVALVSASVMTASAVAISGPIGFVGLICPHLARRMVGHDARRLLPLSAALGAGLLALADALSRSMIRVAGTWPPVGVLTGLLGGPFFLYLLYRQRHAGEAG
ncbi:MAG: transport system permease protein [Phycisphaerales bacterium]|nr:transport system permease protein [Phycisphaerales bacterium]